MFVRRKCVFSFYFADRSVYFYFSVLNFCLVKLRLETYWRLESGSYTWFCVLWILFARDSLSCHCCVAFQFTLLHLPVLLDKCICVGNSDGSLSSSPQRLCWLCNRPIAIEKMGFLFFKFYFEMLSIKINGFVC